MSSTPPQNVVMNHDSSSQQQTDDTASIRTATSNKDIPNLVHLRTEVSHTQDAPVQPVSSFVEVPDEVYDRLPESRKVVIVCLLSFCSFLAPISSTTILSAIPEVASTYKSTGTIINLSNALYMLFMGVSPAFWGPLSQVYGRRWVRFPISLYFHRVITWLTCFPRFAL
jgi:hypothetical protein